MVLDGMGSEIEGKCIVGIEIKKACMFPPAGAVVLCALISASPLPILLNTSHTSPPSNPETTPLQPPTFPGVILLTFRSIARLVITSKVLQVLVLKPRHIALVRGIVLFACPFAGVAALLG